MLNSGYEGDETSLSAPSGWHARALAADVLIRDDEGRGRQRGAGASVSRSDRRSTVSCAPHLENAARVWAAMLAESHPEYVWSVEVCDVDRPDSVGRPVAGVAGDDAGAVTEDAHAGRDRDDAAAAAGSRDDDRFEQAA